MKFSYGPNGTLEFDNAKIIYRNFAGAKGKYNREGDRNFSIVIEDQDLAEELIADGWKIKIKPPRDEDDTPFMHMPVKVKFNNRGPKIYLVTGNVQNELDEESVACLDDIDIASVDLDIAPYNWTDDDGNPGRSAYLRGMVVTQQFDRFAARFAPEEY